MSYRGTLLCTEPMCVGLPAVEILPTAGIDKQQQVRMQNAGTLLGGEVQTRSKQPPSLNEEALLYVAKLRTARTGLHQ